MDAMSTEKRADKNANAATGRTAARSDEATAAAPTATNGRAAVPHRIVIVGGGAAGLALAAQLGDGAGRGGAPYEVTLVDASLTHLWKPLLHEVAAGTLRMDDNEIDFLQQARRHGFRFQLGALERMDRRAKKIWLHPLVDELGEDIAPRRAIEYDTAVIAVGSEVNDFGTPGVQEHAMTLDEAGQARSFHRRLLAACARADLQADGPVRVVIVGGGATGVELAAELNEAAAELAGYGAHLSQLRQPVQVCLVEAAPRLLGGVDAKVAEEALADLKRRGIDVRLDAKVTEVTAHSVRLAGDVALPASLIVWAAGVRGPAVLRMLNGLELNKAGQIVVRPTLQTTRDDSVFALGDCASCTPEPGAPPVPPRAQAARQEARFLADGLRRHLRGQPLPAFRFRDQGVLVALGHRNAVGRVVGGLTGHGYRLDGLAARWAYWALQRQHMVTLHGFLRTALATVGHWLAGRTQPRVKLH